MTRYAISGMVLAAIAACPIGAPGCPLAAFSTASIARQAMAFWAMASDGEIEEDCALADEACM